MRCSFKMIMKYENTSIMSDRAVMNMEQRMRGVGSCKGCIRDGAKQASGGPWYRDSFSSSLSNTCYHSSPLSPRHPFTHAPTTKTTQWSILRPYLVVRVTSKHVPVPSLVNWWFRKLHSNAVAHSYTSILSFGSNFNHNSLFHFPVTPALFFPLP
jgi:hypothetical protein